MALTLLSSVRIGERRYFHTIDTENDATYFCIDLEDGSFGDAQHSIFTVTSDANVTREGRYFGAFRTNVQGQWYFENAEVRIDTHTSDLLKAERMVFGQLLKEEA